MTNQEAFDKAVAGLAAQGFKRSVGGPDGFEQCVYRGKDGKKCALGHLIPDDLYRPRIEGMGAGNPLMRPLLFELGLSIEFSRALQSAHDSAYTIDAHDKQIDAPETMKAMLRRVADKFGLTKPDSLNPSGAA